MAELPLGVLGTGTAHAEYLRRFLEDGFKALDGLKRIDIGEAAREVDKDGGRVEARLPDLGYEKAAKLFAACTAEPSLLSAVYWVVCALTLLGATLAPEITERTIDFVLGCQPQGGGFAPHPQHEPGLLSTLSAVQLLLLLQRHDLLRPGGKCPAESIRRYVRSLRLADGSFRGRQAEASAGDCRFVYAALNALELLQESGAVAEDVSAGEAERNELGATVQWLLRCQNPDGGFGCRPDGECESHAGHTFCCLAGLTLAGGLQHLDARGRKRLVRWLADRQCVEGGLNGRPGKAPDTCYTWWTIASVELLRAGLAAGGSRVPALYEFFSVDELRAFLASCARSTGGLSAHPGDDPDPFHTFFGLAGFSLLETAASGGAPQEHGLVRISPLMALPVKLVPQLLSKGTPQPVTRDRTD